MRRPLIAILLLVTALVLAGTPVAAASYPESIPLPDGFYPEGIEVGTGHDFYVGSLLDGAVYKGDLRTGEGAVLVDGAANRFLAGLAFDQRSGLLWAAGGDANGTAVFAFDARSGDLVHQIDVQGAFLNDLVVARDALYVTDSLAPQFWTVPLTNKGAPAGPARAISLGGDFEFVTQGDLPINLNGIAVTPDGGTLIAVHSTLGVLYRIDPATGVATLIDLGGGAVPSGDGIVLAGKTLYVVENFPNTLAVVRLRPDLSSGKIVDAITSDLFRVPATAAKFGNSLYLVNARFDVAPPPLLGGLPMSIDYDVVKVPLR
jgi:sugar lactone lactonase YvrE